MNLEVAFDKISQIDSRYQSKSLAWCSIDIWPLVRQCLWFEMISVSQRDPQVPISNQYKSYQRRLLNRVLTLANDLRSYCLVNGTESTAFISRPVYLQELPSGVLFDRIVDPLIFCLPTGVRYSKYYVSAWPKASKLHYPAKLLRTFHSFSSVKENVDVAFLSDLAIHAGIDPNRLIKRVQSSLYSFDRWYSLGNRFFHSRKNLKVLYVTSWYFPDMMGLITAARKRDIKVVEVQHGKQGKLQAMYCGWRIPKDGFEMMPDIFWCWGKPSSDHILNSSPQRNLHRPIIGGYPWIDYYCKYISKALPLNRVKPEKTILVTIQSPQGCNSEPIPDFLLSYLEMCASDVYFIFRCHPNYRNGLDYCRRRLSESPQSLYEIDAGNTNLYDSLMISTHHVTAYSSCCYEASAFGVPTLLFGEDASSIYSDEIRLGLFDWTEGCSRDLALWLETKSSANTLKGNAYIRSSLEYSASIIRDIWGEYPIA